MPQAIADGQLANRLSDDPGFEASFRRDPELRELAFHPPPRPCIPLSSPPVTPATPPSNGGTPIPGIKACQQDRTN